MGETLKSAFSQLIGNKLRTFLTMLGMLIGISAVIMILGLGEGLKGFVNDQFATIGKGTIMINAMSYDQDALLTQDDVEMLREIPQVKDVMPMHSGYNALVQNYKKQDKQVMLYGIPYDIEKVQSMNILYGRMFTQQDETLKSDVVIVEDNFAKIMFNKSDPTYALGKTIDMTVGGSVHQFEIVGIAKSQYPSAAPASMIIPIVYGPYTTVDQYIMDGQLKSEQIYVVIDSNYDASEYSKPIRKILEKRHGIEGAYMVTSLLEATKATDDIVNKLNLFTSIVASVSLLVGGIGIMNIMLVTVRERTREIGIRKALGATDKQILTQFLIEALILTLLGGISGLLLGYTGSVLIAGALSIKATLTAGMIIFAVGTSSVIGILFGVYPAYKAAQLDPVEALREE